MQLKYRAYIDGEFHYFDLLKLVWIAQIQTCADDYPICNKVIDWLEQGNQPDVFTGSKDKLDNEIYENDILKHVNTKHVDCIIYDDNAFREASTLRPLSFYSENFVVIGTTHQNKDLLNGN